MTERIKNIKDLKKEWVKRREEHGGGKRRVECRKGKKHKKT